MKEKVRTSLIVAMLNIVMLPIHAQMVKGHISDMSLSKNAVIIYNPDRGGSRYDGYEKKLVIDNSGNFNFSTDNIVSQTFCPAIISLGDDSEWGLVLQPGKTLNINFSKGKDVSVCYSGDNARESEFMNAYEKLYSYDTFFPYDKKKDILTKEQKYSLLDKNYSEAKKLLNKVKDKNKSSFFIRLNEDRYNNFLMRLQGDSLEKTKKMVDAIDVNNWIGLYNYMPQRYIESKMDKKYDDSFGSDMTDYGLEYMRQMKIYVKDSTVKNALLAECAHNVLNYGKNYKDIDRFWIPFKEYAGSDSDVISRYKDKVLSIKNTKTGMKATDISFSDEKGVSHKLSDYYGKVLYIDCWATWCGPCCAEIPYLKNRVVEYKNNKAITFISISVDSNRKMWLNKITKDKPDWLQFNVNKEENVVMSKAYGITGIPRFIVLNADGTICDPDAFRPSDKDFSEKINKIISEQK